MVRHHHYIAAAIALTLALGAAAPAAARFELNPPAPIFQVSTPASTNVCFDVCSASGYAARETGAALPHDPRPRAVVLAGAGYRHGDTPSVGFDWGDAGIGAGGALALMTLLIGAALGAASIRRRATRTTA